MSNPVKIEENEWVKGFACALAALLKYEGQSTSITDELFKCGIGSIRAAIKADVDIEDLQELKKYYK